MTGYNQGSYPRSQAHPFPRLPDPSALEAPPTFKDATWKRVSGTVFDPCALSTSRLGEGRILLSLPGSSPDLQVVQLRQEDNASLVRMTEHWPRLCLKRPERKSDLRRISPSALAASSWQINMVVLNAQETNEQDFHCSVWLLSAWKYPERASCPLKTTLSDKGRERQDLTLC